MTVAIKTHEPLGRHTTFKAGGTALFFADIFTVDDLKEALAFAKEKKLPIIVIGGGSNTLFTDGEHSALVVKIAIKGLSEKENGDKYEITAGAGEEWDTLVKRATVDGLWGIENLSSIPGTVGGAVVQNIGAYGSELKDTLKEVELFDQESGEIKILQNNMCQYGYRSSIFKKPEGRHFIILSATLTLSRDPQPKISYKDLAAFFADRIPQTSGDVREAVIAIRSKKFPDLEKIGTAGSFFENPIVSKKAYAELLQKYPEMPGHETGEHIKLSAAWILDNIMGLKGYEENNVALWQNQPLVVVNLGNASAEEVISFTQKIKSQIKERTGIEFREEVIVRKN